MRIRNSRARCSVPLPFIPFDKDRPASIYTRSLPHWQQEGATYFVTFRLVDSLPKEVFKRWREELDVALREAAHATNASESEKREAAERISEDYREKLERHLETEGIGACWLRDPELSVIVENALRRFDGDRYLLGSYVIMPNHVHVPCARQWSTNCRTSCNHGNHLRPRKRTSCWVAAVDFGKTSPLTILSGTSSSCKSSVVISKKIPSKPNCQRVNIGSAAAQWHGRPARAIKVGDTRARRPCH